MAPDHTLRSSQQKMLFGNLWHPWMFKRSAEHYKHPIPPTMLHSHQPTSPCKSSLLTEPGLTSVLSLYITTDLPVFFWSCTQNPVFLSPSLSLCYLSRPFYFVRFPTLKHTFHPLHPLSPKSVRTTSSTTQHSKNRRGLEGKCAAHLSCI